MFPIVGALGAIASALGLYTLVWFERLSKEDKEKANELACQYARKLYNTGVDQLTSHQLSRVNDLVKAHFNK